MQLETLISIVTTFNFTIWGPSSIQCLKGAATLMVVIAWGGGEAAGELRQVGLAREASRGYSVVQYINELP